MRTLSVRPGQEERDIASGREILQEAIDHPSKTVMIVRYHSPEVARFVDKAATRSDPFPWRETVWVTDRRIFEPGLETKLFDANDTACGVVLDLLDRPVAHLTADATLAAIDRAFRDAGGGAS